MIINTSKVELVLNNKALPAYSIEAETGVSRHTIAKYRRGEAILENFTLGTIMKLQKWIDDGNFKISYDYSELIEELLEDIEEGLTKEYLYIVRDEFNEALGTCPIIDYYYDPEDIEDGDVAEKVRTVAVLAEMELFNQIF